MRCKENANVSGTRPTAHLCPLPVGLTLEGLGVGQQRGRVVDKVPLRDRSARLALWCQH